MSDCLVNIRILYWHFKLFKEPRYNDKWLEVSYNPYHRGKLLKEWPFAIYEFFGL